MTEVATNTLRRRLAQRQRDLREGLEAGASGWLLQHFVAGSAFGLAAALALPALGSLSLEPLHPSSPFFWFRAFGPVALAAVGSPVLYLLARRRARKSVDDLVAESEAEVASMTHPGWVGRTVVQGLLLAAGVGVPVGVLFALLMPVAEFPAESRLLGFGGFLLASASWAIPAAFVFRWLSLRSERQLRDPLAGP